MFGELGRNYYVYNTGDQIWYQVIDGKIIVHRIATHDGITWELGQDKLTFPPKHKNNHSDK